MGVYLDDCASGTTIFGNVFYKVTRAAFIGGGRDNTVENNIFRRLRAGRGHRCPRPQPFAGVARHDLQDHARALWSRSAGGSRPTARAIRSWRGWKNIMLPTPACRRRAIACGHNIVKGANAANGKWLAIRSRATRDMIDVGENLTTEDPSSSTKRG